MIYDLRALQKKRRANLARLDRVNRAIAQWDEYECAQNMLPDVRPQVERPALGRKALESLRKMLQEVLSEMEMMWERKN